MTPSEKRQLKQDIVAFLAHAAEGLRRVHPGAEVRYTDGDSYFAVRIKDTNSGPLWFEFKIKEPW